MLHELFNGNFIIKFESPKIIKCLLILIYTHIFNVLIIGKNNYLQ